LQKASLGLENLTSSREAFPTIELYIPAQAVQLLALLAAREVYKTKEQAK